MTKCEMQELKPFSIKLDTEQKRRHLLGDNPKTVGIRSGQVILKKGESVGEHVTNGKEEVIVVLRGTAEITTNKLLNIEACENSVSYIPPETVHNVKNIGEGDLRYIYIVSPVDKIRSMR